MREAIRALEVLGVVRPATGSGPETGAVIVAGPVAGLHVATSGGAVRSYAGAGGTGLPGWTATARWLRRAPPDLRRRS